MSTFLQGENATFTAQFFEFEGGPAQDLTGVTAEITRIGDADPTVPQTSTGLTHPATGLYAFVWDVPVAQATGDHVIVWRGTDPQGDLVQTSEVFTIEEMVSGTWASIADVLEITGKTVDAAQVRRAQYVVDMSCGRTYEIHDMLVANLRNRDLRWLKMAVAYQAAWMPSQPDMFERMNVTNVNADSSSATFGVDAMSLGPLARKALNRVSWRGTRSLKVQRDRSQILPFQQGRGWYPPGSPIVDRPEDHWEQM